MIRSWFQRVMVGRYGPDNIFIACYVGAMALWLLSFIRVLGWLQFAGLALIVYATWRFFSKKVDKRRAENERFMSWWTGISRKLAFQQEKFRSRGEYRFFRCPACSNNLRVPRGKGSIVITCPKCGERFTRKT
jgi:ribosomal protein S27E